jgi:hypothetical protein
MAGIGAPYDQQFYELNGAEENSAFAGVGASDEAAYA